MRIKLLCFGIIMLLGMPIVTAQESKNLTLKEAVHTALEHSDDAKIAEINTSAAQNELVNVQNNQYPDVSVSGQYRYLTNANAKILIPATNNPETLEAGQEQTTPDINQLLLGQANVSMPLFSGFRLKNSIKAGKNELKAANYDAESRREELALYTIQAYVNLYKAERTVALVEENLKSARQRVKDFSAMEENGLLARNDLLKAELQESNIALSLAQARKNVRILNYRLVSFLKLPKETVIQVDTSSFDQLSLPVEDDPNAERPDVKALQYQKIAADDRVKVSQANYYPSIALTGGYVALDLENALEVTNAMNIGVAVSYNFADIFKNKSQVRAAKNRSERLNYQLEKAQDAVNVEVKNALEEYKLAQTNYEVYQSSVEQAVENYRIVKDKYDNGLQDTNDLLEADVQRLQTKIDLATARANVTQRYYELQKAKGSLVSNLKY